MKRWLWIAATMMVASAARADEPVGLPFVGGFADSSNVPLFLPESKITVATKYGKLAVPLSEIVRIELGFRYPEGMEKKIAAATEELGNADYARREAAQKQLTAWGELALPTLKKAMKTGNAEAASRAEAIVNKLLASLPRDHRETPEQDTIITEESTIRGTLETTVIKANTKFFGATDLKLADLRLLRNSALDHEPKPAKPVAYPPGAGNPFGQPGAGGRVIFLGGGR